MKTAVKSQALQRIAAYFEEAYTQGLQQPIWMPQAWNTCGYSELLEGAGAAGEIRVDAVALFHTHLQQLLETGKPAEAHNWTPSSAESVIYSSLVRYTTAWDTDHDGEIESGTFLRLMLLLPLLKRMGVNLLYMLPITKYSTKNLKGDIGSPYAVQSLVELDPNLHDELLDGLADFTLHDELAALVEACHLLGIRVVMDFIPRVTARNSDLIVNHPEWVYWIHKEALEGFCPPHIPELGFFEECTPDKLETVYRSAGTAEFLAKFTEPPNVLNPELWSRLRQRALDTGEDLLELVEQEMGITTSPAHSDWINDVQPIWTDITFLRLYEDIAPQARQYVSDNQAPYVLFDTIKCNYYPAEQPHRALWDHLIEAMKFGMQRYGIDGFRIDIGHVLPVPLLDEMVRTVKALCPHAVLISEDLFNRNHKKAAAVGYNIMLGSGWNVMTEITKPNLETYLNELPELMIPVFACAETADTPRITSRGGVELARMIAVFNHFLPNAIPFIATGFELNEEQPMNCGLGDNTNGAEIPRAFFNKLTLNWTNEAPMIALLEQLHACKQRWLEQLEPQLLEPRHFTVHNAPAGVVVYGYSYEGSVLLGCFNLNAEASVTLQLGDYAAAVSVVAAVPGASTATGGLLVEIDSARQGNLVGSRVVEVTLAPLQGIVATSKG